MTIEIEKSKGNKWRLTLLGPSIRGSIVWSKYCLTLKVSNGPEVGFADA